MSIPYLHILQINGSCSDYVDCITIFNLETYHLTARQRTKYIIDSHNINFKK